MRPHSSPSRIGVHALLALGFALLSSPAGSAQQAPEAPANVVLVVLDDVGIEKLGFYRYNPLGLNSFGPPVGPIPTPRTPRLEQLAFAGIRFTRAYASPVCSATRATLLTGRYPFRTGMGNLSDRAADLYTLPTSEWTIPRVLARGRPGKPPYHCGAFGKWHLAHGSNTSHPLDLGFETFVGAMSNDKAANGNHFDWDLVRVDARGATQTRSSTYSASLVRAEASTWIDAVSEPFFAYVCFNPPHAPAQVPPLSTLSPETQAEIAALEAQQAGLQYEEGDSFGGYTEDGRRAFDWMIESVDTEIGRLYDAIPAAKRARTTFLIVGDNGTPGPFILQPPYDDANAKGTAFEQGSRVPFIASGYRVNGAGLRHESVVSTVDVLRTVASLAQATLPPLVVLDSVDLQSVLQNPRAAGPRTQRPAFVQYFERNGAYVPDPLHSPGKTPHWRAMSDGTYKYLRFEGAIGLLEGAFHVAADPTERRNLLPTLDPESPEGQAIELLRDRLIELSGG